MKREKMYDAITGIDDALVDAAAAAAPRRRRRPWWSAAVAAVLVLAIAGGIFLRPGGPLSAGAYTLVQAEYPDFAPYPKGETGGDAWYDQRRERLDQPSGYDSGLWSFFDRSAGLLLSGGGEENRICSPLNIYLALGMLAEVTDGESRAQLLRALGADSLDTLRTQARSVWTASCFDDGAAASLLAASLWLNRDIAYRTDTLEALSEHYYASSFQGEMGSAGLDAALQRWLNEQTGGLLKEQAGKISLDPNTVLALATTVYFTDKWSGKFAKEDTAPQTFYSPSGELTCDFLHQRTSGSYYWGEQFSAVTKRFDHSGQMWLFLPDEGVDAQALLRDEQVLQLLRSGGASDQWENRRDLFVNLSLPKFDVNSDLDLIPSLRELGITDVLDPDLADFTPLTESGRGANGEPLVLSQAKHAARVSVDEDGCTAAAYTVLAVNGAGAPPADEVDFTLDRPFLFVITNEAGLPLFAGVVNYPA